MSRNKNTANTPHAPRAKLIKTHNIISSIMAYINSVDKYIKSVILKQMRATTVEIWKEGMTAIDYISVPDGYSISYTNLKKFIQNYNFGTLDKAVPNPFVDGMWLERDDFDYITDHGVNAKHWGYINVVSGNGKLYIFEKM